MHLFFFYQISELLGQDAALSITLKDVANDAERTFFDILKARGDKILRYPPPIAVDLSPPLAVAEAMSAWQELFTTYSEMMVPSGGSKPDFQPVLSALLDPVIQVKYMNSCLLACWLYIYVYGNRSDICMCVHGASHCFLKRFKFGDMECPYSFY